MFPLATNGSAERPFGFIGDLKDVPLLTSDHDPQSGATRLKDPGHCFMTHTADNLQVQRRNLLENDRRICIYIYKCMHLLINDVFQIFILEVGTQTQLLKENPLFFARGQAPCQSLL